LGVEVYLSHRVNPERMGKEVLKSIKGSGGGGGLIPYGCSLCPIPSTPPDEGAMKPVKGIKLGGLES
jgi:hypothetical protein